MRSFVLRPNIRKTSMTTMNGFSHTLQNQYEQRVGSNTSLNCMSSLSRPNIYMTILARSYQDVSHDRAYAFAAKNPLRDNIGRGGGVKVAHSLPERASLLR